MDRKTKIELQQLIKGERPAQSLFFDQYSRWAFAICLRYMSQSHLAEEAMQDGFLKIFKSISKYDDSKASIKTWMSTIFVRTCLDKLRVQSELWHKALETIDEINAATEDYESLSDSNLMETIKQMPEGYRVVFNLYVIEGYDHNEIGEILGIKPVTSRSRYHRGKTWLRGQLHYSKSIQL